MLSYVSVNPVMAPTFGDSSASSRSRISGSSSGRSPTQYSSTMQNARANGLPIAAQLAPHINAASFANDNVAAGKATMNGAVDSDSSEYAAMRHSDDARSGAASTEPQSLDSQQQQQPNIDCFPSERQAATASDDSPHQLYELMGRECVRQYFEVLQLDPSLAKW